MNPEPRPVDPAKTRLVLPLVSVAALVASVAAGTWTLSEMRADIRGQIRELGRVSELRWEQVERQLGEVKIQLSAMGGDHSSFVTRAQLRTFARTLHQMNEGTIKVPEVE